MKTETHLKYIKESLQVIEESIKTGILERQRTIAFSASAAYTDMLELLLHKNNLINHGFLVKHEWLKSKNKIQQKFPFNFPKKEEILDLTFKLESKRNPLCYGSPATLETMQKFIEDFNKLKEKFKEAGLDEF